MMSDDRGKKTAPRPTQSDRAEKSPAGSGKRKEPKAPRRIRPISPNYELEADWRGLELLPSDSMSDWCPPGLPGSLPEGRFPVAPHEPPIIGSTAADYVASANAPLEVPDLQCALDSARMALRPFLDSIVAGRLRDGHAGQKVAKPETLTEYQQIVRIILNHYCRPYDRDPYSEDISMTSVAEWLLSRRLAMNLKTWKNYRCAFIWFLERSTDDDAAYAISLLNTEDDDIKSGNGRADSRRTRYFDPVDFDQTLEELKRNRSAVRSQRISDYLRANICVGLRPWEFLCSEMRMVPHPDAPNGRQLWLFVCNAKFHEERSNGPIRALNLTGLDNAYIEAIWRTMRDVRLQYPIIGYRAWLQSINAGLHKIHAGREDSSGRPIRYTAYSLRHQAISNWKSQYGRVAVAALAGHAFPGGALAAYGEPGRAWSSERIRGLQVIPSGADIARIEARLAEHKRSCAARLDRNRRP